MHSQTSSMLSNQVDFNSDYTNHQASQITVTVLPLMYIFDLSDIMFFIKHYKLPHPGFNVTDYITFATGNTQLATHIQTRSSDNIAKNFYFNRLPRIWNHLPIHYQLRPQCHYNQAKITYPPLESLSI